MKFILDTHLLLWAAGNSDKLPTEAYSLLADRSNELFFSVTSVWEIAIKQELGRRDFSVDTHLLRRGLLDNGYSELLISSEHAIATSGLPPLHKDPFDRMLVAQATVEGITLLTADAVVARYPGPIRKI